MKIDLYRLKEIISKAKTPQIPKDNTFKLASVFLLLFNLQNPKILAILKTDTKGYPWRNQVALPGGHVDKGERSIHAAYREISEELNIEKNEISYLGSLGHFPTIYNRDIEVFVGMWEEKKEIKFDTNEIAQVLKIPLSDLIQTHKDLNFHNRIPSMDELKYPYSDLIIWGATAKIFHYFIELLIKSP